MKGCYKYLYIALLLTLAFPTTLSAQMCRLKCSVSTTGETYYREVFEYDYVSDKPCFPGGESDFMKFINSTREYPTEAYNNGVQGRVVCSFVVDPDGSISNLEVLKGVSPSLNQEALRVLSLMPTWTPGKMDGVEVPVRVIKTIPFRK